MRSLYGESSNLKRHSIKQTTHNCQKLEGVLWGDSICGIVATNNVPANAQNTIPKSAPVNSLNIVAPQIATAIQEPDKGSDIIVSPTILSLFFRAFNTQQHLICQHRPHTIT